MSMGSDYLFNANMKGSPDSVFIVVYFHMVRMDVLRSLVLVRTRIPQECHMGVG